MWHRNGYLIDDEDIRLQHVIQKNMAKATTIKEALKRWEDQKKENSADATVIELQFQWPPIEKMDNALSALVNCE